MIWIARYQEWNKIARWLTFIYFFKQSISVFLASNMPSLKRIIGKVFDVSIYIMFYVLCFIMLTKFESLITNVKFKLSFPHIKYYRKYHNLWHDTKQAALNHLNTFTILSFLTHENFQSEIFCKQILKPQL